MRQEETARLAKLTERLRSEQRELRAELFHATARADLLYATVVSLKGERDYAAPNASAGYPCNESVAPAGLPANGSADTVADRAQTAVLAKYLRRIRQLETRLARGRGTVATRRSNPVPIIGRRHSDNDATAPVAVAVAAAAAQALCDANDADGDGGAQVDDRRNSDSAVYGSDGRFEDDGEHDDISDADADARDGEEKEWAEEKRHGQVGDHDRKRHHRNRDSNAVSSEDASDTDDGDQHRMEPVPETPPEHSEHEPYLTGLADVVSQPVESDDKCAPTTAGQAPDDRPNGDTGKADGDEDVSEDEDEEEEENASDLASSVDARELDELRLEIARREQIMQELERTKRKLQRLQEQYEQQLTVLREKIRAVEDERDTVLKRMDCMASVYVACAHAAYAEAVRARHVV